MAFEQAECMPSPLERFPGERLPRGAISILRGKRFPKSPAAALPAAFLLCLMCTSCGAVGSGAPPAPASVVVLPDAAQPFVGGSVQFSAQVENAANPAVTWQVNQVPGGNATVGTITPTGYYTAPTRIPSTPSVTVTAALQSNQSLSGSATVTIQPLSSIQGTLAISPKLSSVTTSQTLQLSVQIPGGVDGNSDVSWTVSCLPAGTCAPGTISPSGLFTPPDTPGSDLVTATLLANPSVTGSATVEVTDFPGALTWRNDNARSGMNSHELALAPSTVSSSTFGKLFSCPIDGYAYAQPLYVPNLAIPGKGIHNVVFVATEKDSVYAFDADAGPCNQLWKASLIPPGDQPIISTPLPLNISPSMGITGTPVIALDSSALYAVAALQDAATASTYSFRLYALDLGTGSAIPPGGVPIANSNSVFDTSVESQGSALLLDGGSIYIGFGSSGASTVFHGWLFRQDASSLLPAGSFEVTSNPNLGGEIGQSGGGPSADSSHNVFVVTGDGNFALNGTARSFANSFLRFATSGGLSLLDYFTPCDEAALHSAGLDVGASAPVLLPDSAGSASQQHLLLGGSKGGTLYVVNRDNMGGFQAAPCPDSLPRAQSISVGAPILSTPLFWDDTVYVAPGNGRLMSFAMSQGILASSPSSSLSQETLGPQGATPVISSHGAGNAILWLIDSSGAFATPNAPAVLRAYDPANNLNEIYNSAMNSSRDASGPAVTSAVPTVANGKVYVGTQTELDVYGLLP